MTFPYNETQEQIRQNMVSRMGDTVSTNEGSFGDLIARAVSYEIWRFYEQLRALTAIAFPDSDSGLYLEKRCAEYGITRKQADYALVTLTFTGSVGTNIPKGTTAQADDGLTFDTLSSAVIQDSGTVDILSKATNTGSLYNVSENKITTLLTSINGVSSVTNKQSASGGLDTETDLALYERLNIRRQSKASSGNTADYIQWALAVEGVGACRAIELWDGANTVLVVIASPELLPVEDEVCKNVHAYIETQRPVGAIPTVKSAEAVTLNINAEITLENNAQIESIKSEFIKQVNAYLKDIAWNEDTVVYSRILYRLLGIAGVSDYKSLTINGDTQNITLQDTNIPTIGEVNIIDTANS